MRIKLLGNKYGPLLVCIHGLMGAADDFDSLIPEWEKHFHIVLLDLVSDYEEKGFRVEHNGQEVVCFDTVGPQIAAYLKNEFPGQSAYFTGVSLGGRVIYDIAAQEPKLVKGAVITDLGPSSIVDTELFKFLTTVVPALNLEQDWDGIKAEFAASLPDRRLRVLLQSQVVYDKQKKTGAWKDAIVGIQGAIEASVLHIPWEKLEKNAVEITVLKATHICGITSEDLVKMKCLKSFTIKEIEGSNHFLHLSHTKEYLNTVLDLMAPKI